MNRSPSQPPELVTLEERMEPYDRIRLARELLVSGRSVRDAFAQADEFADEVKRRIPRPEQPR